MANKTYAQWRQEKLADPTRAVRYLRAAARQSNEAFFHAVKNVVQAHKVTRIAKEVGVARESIYRSFSEEGNPAYTTVKAVLDALGLSLDIVEKEVSSGSVPQAQPRKEVREEPVRSGSGPKIPSVLTPNVRGGYISGQFGVGKLCTTINTVVQGGEAVLFQESKWRQPATAQIGVIANELPFKQASLSVVAPIECVIASQQEDEAREMMKIYG